MRNNSPGEADTVLNARGVTYDDFMRDLADLHSRVKSWRFVGEVLGVSGAYARLIAQGHRVAGKPAVLRWLEYRAVNKPARRPRRFYRPCLPVELGQQVKLHGIDVEALLTQAVKSAILDEQWRERMHEV